MIKGKDLGVVMYPVNQNCANSPIKFDNSLKHLIPQMQYDNPKEGMVHEVLHSAHSLSWVFFCFVFVFLCWVLSKAKHIFPHGASALNLGGHHSICQEPRVKKKKQAKGKCVHLCPVQRDILLFLFLDTKMQDSPAFVHFRS